MKTILAVILFAVSVFAQQAPALHPACGPLRVNFDTAMSAGQPPSKPEPGKALVYVAEDFPAVIAATIKVGLDGHWVGAIQGPSYVVFTIDPGEHHLCINWQSSLRRFSKLVSFAHVTADSGKTYYFRARAISFNSASDNYLDLDAIDSDEGEYLVASSKLSTAQEKK